MSATDQAVADDATVRGEATEDEREQTTAARKNAELATRDDFTLPARHQWDGSQVAVIRKTVAKDCDANELAMFLEVAARYKLDPFTREIFAAKFNGSSGPVTIFAGRDGLLKAAKIAAGTRLRHMESHVVREQDEYEVIVDTDNLVHEVDSPTETTVRLDRIRKLRHVRRGLGTGTYDEESGKWIGGRGPIIGAYALVWMEGEEAPWFAEATWEDYGEPKQRTAGGKDTNWTLGKGYTEAMMIKVPQSIALRMACGLAGLYAQEEVQKQLDERSHQDLSGSADPTSAPPSIDWPEGELGLQLQALVERANELVPNSWRTAKVAVNVNGKTEDEHKTLAAKLRHFIGQREPNDPLVAEEPELITDAEVVPDEPERDERMQGPIADAVLGAAHDDEAAREIVQARLEELRLVLSDDVSEHYLEGVGFTSVDAVIAEVGRLEEGLREATNGGETVAEAIEDEEPAPEWNEQTEAELAELEEALPALKAQAEEAEEGSEEHRVLAANYMEALERWEAIREAQAGAE
jgi:hypothetical protein